MVENGMRLLCNLEVFLVLDGKKNLTMIYVTQLGSRNVLPKV